MSANVSSTCRSAYHQLRQYVHCPSMLRRRLSSRSCQHAWTTANCNSLMHGIADGLMQRLQAVQNAAARLIIGARRRDHISPVHRQLHWLPVRHGQAPQCLTDDCQLVAAAGCRQLRSSDAVTCLVPRTRTCRGDRALYWCCRTTSVERFAHQPPSVSPLPWAVSTGAKTHLFDYVCRA